MLAKMVSLVDYTIIFIGKNKINNIINNIVII